MRTGLDLLEDVRRTQEELGGGDPAQALNEVEPLLDETREAVRAVGFLRRAPADRERVLEAFCYARVTAVLALESQGAATALPRIRAIVGETLDVATADAPAWKVLAAAGEILARCGDGDGARRAVDRAVELGPGNETYLVQLRGSIRSMFPEVEE